MENIRRRASAWKKARTGAKTELELGLFGGSFNPIHNGHIDMARRVKAQFGLDCVLFMVAKEPPHKTLAGGVPATARLAMAEAALAGEDGLFASGMELARPGKSYTVDTVRALLAEAPNARLSLIVGEDMLKNLPTWREAEPLLQLVRVIAVARPGVEGSLSDAAEILRTRCGAQVEFASFSGQDVSSTLVRTRLHEAQPVSAFLPPAVERMIYENAFYQEEAVAQKQEKLRAALNKKRYEHSIGTMRCAIALAARWNADGAQARLAGLLHDCAKLPAEQLIALAAEYGLPVDEFERETPGLLHDRIGALLARDVYGVREESVLDAIRRHTLGSVDMTLLDKIVYLADKIEPTRDYPGVDALRSLSGVDLDRAVLACMDSVHAHLVREGRSVKPEGETVRNALQKKLEAKTGRTPETRMKPEPKTEVES